VTTPFRVPRVRPVTDLSERLTLRRALPLVGVEVLGLALLLSIYAALHAQRSVLAPLLVPPVVSFVLIIATATAVGSRPGRVVVSYLIAGVFGLGVAIIPGPPIVEAVVAGGLALLAMHLTGAMHSPAIAAAIIAALARFGVADAARALPLLLAVAVVVVVLAWLAHRVLGDEHYPARIW
jgi:CBS-domain-containing membrane protein